MTGISHDGSLLAADSSTAERQQAPAGPLPLFLLDRHPERYAHLLLQKDALHIAPIVTYLIGGTGQTVFLSGDAVRNIRRRGRRHYRVLNVLAVLTASADVDRYACILNNIISSNDGAFSMEQKYRVKKNRTDGCFREVALARYIIEPRLEGFEKLLYPFRPSTIELDLTTHSRFSHVFKDCSLPSGPAEGCRGSDA